MKTRVFGIIATICLLLPGAAILHASAPNALRISSITFSAPVPLKAGDIVTVDLAGTPGMKAAFAVKSLIAATQLKEQSPGSYRGTAVVPTGKFVRNAPLVGYLGIGNAHAAPVQASRLVTVVEPLAEPAKLPTLKPQVAVAKPVEVIVPKPQPIAKPTPPPAVIAPAPKLSNKLTIESPADGAVIRRVISVKGIADPSSTVKVLVTYSNGLSGMLRLSGSVASQDVAVGKNGEFKMGPIALDGPLATDGLRFVIKAYYPDRVEHGTAEVGVTGKRD